MFYVPISICIDCPENEINHYLFILFQERLTFLVDLVPDGDGVTAEWYSLVVEDVTPHAREARRTRDTALIRVHVHTRLVHQQEVPGQWSVRGQWVVTMRSVSGQWVVSMTSVSDQCEVSVWSVWDQWVVSMRSVSDQCVVSVRSVCGQCEVSEWSVRTRTHSPGPPAGSTWTVVSMRSVSGQCELSVRSVWGQCDVRLCVMTGQWMASMRSVCGQHEVSEWSVCGQHEVSEWSVCGQHEVSEWSVWGQWVVSMRSVSGQYEVSEWSVWGRWVVSMRSVWGQYEVSEWSVWGQWMVSECFHEKMTVHLQHIYSGINYDFWYLQMMTDKKLLNVQILTIFIVPRFVLYTEYILYGTFNQSEPSCQQGVDTTHLAAWTTRVTLPSFRSKMVGVFQFFTLKQTHFKV